MTVPLFLSNKQAMNYLKDRNRLCANRFHIRDLMETPDPPEEFCAVLESVYKRKAAKSFLHILCLLKLIIT